MLLNIEQLKTELEKLGYPLAYGEFIEPTPLPYIAYFEIGAETFGADNEVLAELQDYDIEFYSEEKDIQAERKIRNLLSDLKIPYDKISTYISSERMYMTSYQIRIIDK